MADEGRAVGTFFYRLRSKRIDFIHCGFLKSIDEGFQKTAEYFGLYLVPLSSNLFGLRGDVLGVYTPAPLTNLCLVVVGIVDR